MSGDPVGDESPTSPSGAAVAAPMSRADRHRAERAARSKRRWKRILVGACSFVAFLLLVAAAGAGFLWYENNRIDRIDVKHLKAVPTSGVDKDVENILLIGSTTRCGLAQQNTAFGLCDEGVTGVNSDVVMILHLDPDHHRASLLSIPRDTFVPNARSDGVNKIDAALGDPSGGSASAGDPSQLVAAIEDDFGIPIQHFVELNFDSFQAVVEALGGVKMYFPMPVYDASSSLHVMTTGCQVVNGFEALALVRARHLQYDPPGVSISDVSAWPYDPQSDLSRIRRDHEFLRVLASAVAARGLSNPITDIRLTDAIAGDLVTDSGLDASQIANLVLTFHGLDPYDVPTYTLPIVEDSEPAYIYRGGDYNEVVFPVQPMDQQVVSRFLDTSDGADSSGRQLPTPSGITVAVENGSGAYDQASQTAASLQALGYQVTSVGDTEVSATTTEATVLYSSPAQLDDALRVQSDLSGLATIGYDPGLFQGNGTIDVGSAPDGPQPDVVLVTGSNFSVDSPPSTSAPKGSSSPGAKSTTTTQASTTTQPPTTTQPASSSSGAAASVSSDLDTNSDLASPSASVQQLEPWDPRSCTASGGPGP